MKIIGGSIHLLIELVFLILILFGFGIRTSWFQTFLAQQAAAYLSSELKTEIRIDKVDIVFFDRIDIEGVYIEDKIKDTLLYSEQINLKIDDFSLSKSFVDLKEVSLSNSHAHIIKYKNDSTFNFQHLVDYFASEEEDTTESKPFRVNVQKLVLDNINFLYQDQNAKVADFGIDYSNLHIKNLSGSFSDYKLAGGVMSMKIQDLHFRERSGLTLSKFSTDFYYAPTAIVLDHLQIGFSNTLLISDHFALKTPNGSSDYADFLHKVIFEGNIRNTVVDLSDLAYLVPAIKGMDTKINLNNVLFSGPVYGMDLKKMDISLLDSTIIRGDFKIPNFDSQKAEFLERIDHFQTTVADLERIKLTPFLGGPDYLDLPASMATANLIELKNGYFSGTLDNFIVDGDLTSGLGNVSSEYGLNFYLKDEKNPIYYFRCGLANGSGQDVIVENLDLGALSGNPLLGITSGYVSIKEGSKGLNMEDLDLHFTGDFSQIELNDYAYQNILIKEGNFSDNVFKGVIDVEDDNLDLVYSGLVDLKGDMRFDFDVTIAKSRLDELKLQESGLADFFKSKIHVNIQGTNLENIKGELLIQDLVYKEKDINLIMDSLTLSITRSLTSDTVILRSDFIDIDLTGKFDLTNLWPVVQTQLARVVSNYFDEGEILTSANEHFEFDINLKDVGPLIQFTGLDLSIAQNSEIKSSYSKLGKNLSFEITSDLVTYEEMQFTDIYLKNKFDSVRTTVQYEIGHVKISDSLAVKNAALFSYVKDNQLSTNIGWDGAGSVEPALFAFNTTIRENHDVYTEFKPSFFFLQSNKWTITPKSSVLWNPETIEFTDFDLREGNHLISIHGKVSKQPKDWLYFEVHDFDLADLNGLLGGTTIGGILNIEGGVSDVYNNIRFMSMSDIKDLVVEGELVGDLIIDNKWNKENNSVGIYGTLKRNSKETFRFSGNYFTELEKDNLDLDLIFDNTDIAFLNAFSDPDLYTNISGRLNGKLKVTGELVSPAIHGDLEVQSAKAVVPMLNIGVGLAGTLNFTTSKISGKSLKVYDQEGNVALGSLVLEHKNWSNIKYDFSLDMESEKTSKRFMAMNTFYKDGDLYYGKAYVSGDMRISGNDEIVKMDIDATTEKGTDLILAMYGTSDIEENSFIVYDSIVPVFDINALNASQSKLETTGLIMNMKFNITKDTKAKIVFDPIYDDQIVVNAGEGNLELYLDEFGEMSMYGKYNILNGMYNMRVKGLVSKDFIISDKSTLAWTGSPYDAIIDIDAIYKTNLSFEPILPPGIEDQTNKKEELFATLHMGNKLMSPTISFYLNAPKADDISKTALQAISADQDQLNKQFFSILALGKFLPANGGAGGGGNAAFDFAEGQINTILDGVSDKYEIAADLESGKAALDLSTKLSEKITLITSLGVVSGDDKNAGGIIGDLTVEYRLNDDGTFTLTAFNESNQGTDAEKGPFTQGVGINYQETFSTSRDFKLLQGFLNIFRSRAKDVNYKKPKSNGRMKSVAEAKKAAEETTN